jgi:hypothetical protein
MSVSIILSIILLGAAFVLFFFTEAKFSNGIMKKVALSIYTLVAIGSLVNICIQAFMM